MDFDYVDKNETLNGCRIVIKKENGAQHWGVIKSNGEFLVPLFFHNIVVENEDAGNNRFRVDLTRKQEVHSYWTSDTGKDVDNGRDMIRGVFKLAGGYDY